MAKDLLIGIAGCTGRMGVLLVDELLSGQWEGMALAGGSVRHSPLPEASFFVTDDPAALFDKADMVIDFTAPEATATHVRLAAEQRKPLIIGTTGLNPAQEQHIRNAARECPILYAANTSIGINLLLSLIEQAAARLDPSWDIEILETHHRNKADAPSGTALALSHAAIKGRGYPSPMIISREGHTGSRPPSAIGFAVRRGGDVVGEHTISFYGDGETLELTHRSANRALYAKGALRAARWLKDQPPHLYGMRDVFSPSKPGG